MKQILRYSLIALFTIIGLTNVSAQGTTFNFDDDYAKLFPELKGVSSNESQDGDFTTAMKSVEVNGFTVTVSPADEGVTNANRIWTSAPRLRMYSGTLTISGTGIKKIEFTSSSNKFNVSASTGTLDGTMWTGEANEVVFKVSKNTQINKLVINDETSKGEEGNYGTAEAPLTVAQALEIAGTLEDGATTSEDVYTKGIVTKITTDWSSQYNNVSFEISNDGGTTSLLVYRCTSEAADYVLVGDEVVICGKLKNYKGTLEYDAKCMIVDLKQGEGHNGSGEEKPEGQGNYGTAEAPLTVAQALEIAGTLEDGATTSEDVYTKGIVTKITTDWSSQYNNVSFEISNDGGTTSLLVYRCTSEAADYVLVGDEVVICGKLKNYKGTLEYDAKCKIVSLKQGEGHKGDTPDEPQISLITVAKALETINALENGATTSENYQVKGFIVGAPDFQRKKDGTLYGNVNFTMADEKNGTTLLTVFRAKSYDNQSFTEETMSLLKEGDEVVLQGQLQKYVDNDVVTPEIKNCFVISINGQASGISAITADEQNAPMYNLGGQRVGNGFKGIVIKNGKKYIVK